MLITRPDLLLESEAQAKEYYGPLAYHNWDGHIISMVDYAKKRFPELEKLGIVVNAEVVIDGIVWHDADTPQDPTKYGFNSQEFYASWLSANHLSDIGRDEEYVESVVKGIWATEKEQACTTNESTLIVEADMHNVAGNPSVFYINSLKLAIEKMQLGQTVPSDAAKYFGNTANFLIQFFQKPLIYTTSNGQTIENTAFSTAAKRNIDMMGKMTLDVLQKIPGCQLLIPDNWRK